MIDAPCQLEMTEKQLREQLDAVYASTSWRLTAPLRWLVRSLKPSAIRSIAPKRTLAVLIRRVATQPALQRFGQRVLRRFPNTKMRIKRLVLRSNVSAHGYAPGLPSGAALGREANLSPPAQAILRELHSLRHKK